MSTSWPESTSERFANAIRHSGPQDFSTSPSLRMLRDTVNLEKVKSALSIGSGNGRFEIALMNHYSIVFDFIEPSPIMHTQLVENLRSHGGPGSAGTVFSVPFEKFSTESRYDLVYASHSFYFLKDPVVGFEQAFRLLKPDGDLVIIMHKSDSFGFHISEKFSAAPLQNGFTADWLQKQINTPSRLEVIEIPLPYEQFFECGDLSPRGRASVEFYAQRDWDSFSAQEKQQAREFFATTFAGGFSKEIYGLLHVRAANQGSSR
jgi:SAM-dependent methyltransferase